MNREKKHNVKWILYYEEFKDQYNKILKWYLSTELKKNILKKSQTVHYFFIAVRN